MGDYIGPLFFLVVVFVGFGLAHRNRYRSCSGCEDDCTRDTCKK